MSFETFDLLPRLMTNIADLGYTAPTPIQTQAIPSVLEGRDVMGLAQTGTGKTAAFILPILQRMLTQQRGPRGVVRALVVVPTRELAEQVHTSACDLGKGTGIRSASIYGGVGFGPQAHKLRVGVEIVVACPGRLLDHMNQGTIDLSKLDTLVLDEADHMFDMGFLPDIRRILKAVPRERQTLLFSATMPDDIRHLANDVLTNPVTVQIGHAAPAATVSHALYPVEPHLKTGLLLDILRTVDTGSVLVFTRTKHRAKRVGQQLERAGHKAASLQGNLSQNRRQAALDGFRSGEYRILVATDIAARGIDVAQVSHVINYDIPDTTDAYTHRIGRTGRAARTGDAYTFISAEDTPTVRAIERVLGEKIARRTVEGFDYSVPAPRRDEEFARPPREPRGVKSARPRSDRSDRSDRSRSDRPAGPAQPGRQDGQPSRSDGARFATKPAAKAGPKSGPKSGAAGGERQSGRKDRNSSGSVFGLR